MKSENILKVIAVFKKVLPMAVRKKHLDMMQCSISGLGHVCGTVHCHAGWFYVGARIGHALDDEYIGYTDGIVLMCKMLGVEPSFSFEESYTNALEQWAIKNEELWGNDRGGAMFVNVAAFYHRTKRPFGAKNLQHIIDHWTEVYERVRATEQPTQPYSIDLTRQLAVLPSDRREVDLLPSPPTPVVTTLVTNLK